MDHHTVSIPNFDRLALCGHRQHGSRLFVASWCRGVFSVDLETLAVPWSACHESQPWQLEREQRILAQRGALWVSPEYGLVAHLIQGDEGVTIEAISANDGRPVWTRYVPPPPPADWAEAEPAWPGAPTEELQAFFAADDSALAVLLYRTTRRSVCYPPGTPLPEFHSQLDILGLDPHTGRTRFESSLSELRVELLERDRFDGLCQWRDMACIIDWQTGQVTQLSPLHRDCCWPRRVGPRVIGAWRERGGVRVVSFARENPDDRITQHIQRKRVDELCLHTAGEMPVLQINQQTVLGLGSDLSPKWEQRTPPYVYGVNSLPSGPVFVGTSGNGGSLFAFDRDSGAVRLAKKLKDGAAQVVPVHGTTAFAARFWDGVVFADGQTCVTREVRCNTFGEIVASWRGSVLGVRDEPASVVRITIPN